MPYVQVLQAGTEENEVYIRYQQRWAARSRASTSQTPDTVRIAIIGDSYAEALQVPLATTFLVSFRESP